MLPPRSDAQAASRVINVDDARRRARRKLPPVVFDLIDGGADDEITLRANRAAFQAVVLRPRAAVHVPEAVLETTVFGQRLAFPLLLDPCGFNNLAHPDAEIAAARAAAEAGIMSVLACPSSTPLEEVMAGAPGSRQWFQLYFYTGRAGAEELVGRAQAAGYGALVVTVDTAVVGHRERDLRHRATPPFNVDLRTAIRFAPQLAARPPWLYRFLRSGARLELPHGVRPKAKEFERLTVNELASALANHPPTWADIAWIRSIWHGPLLVKGVLTAEDAARAIDAGADGVVVSNHGGRQLDGVPASLHALWEIAERHAAELTLLLDSGVRRGSDIVKARALGADAVLIGRPYLYGLAVGGQAGVARVIEILRQEFLRTLLLLGCDDQAKLDGTWVQPAGAWPFDRPTISGYDAP